MSSRWVTIGVVVTAIRKQLVGRHELMGLDACQLRINIRDEYRKKERLGDGTRRRDFALRGQRRRKRAHRLQAKIAALQKRLVDSRSVGQGGFFAFARGQPQRPVVAFVDNDGRAERRQAVKLFAGKHRDANAAVAGRFGWH